MSVRPVGKDSDAPKDAQKDSETKKDASRLRALRGTADFEKKLLTSFRKYEPPLSSDYSLLALSAAYFRANTMVDNAIRSFEQSFLAIQRMLPTQFKHTIRGLTTNGDKVEITFWYDNLEYISPNNVLPDQPPLPAMPMLAILTGQTYSCYVSADFHATMTLVETTEERQGRLRTRITSFLQMRTEGPKIGKGIGAPAASPSASPPALSPSAASPSSAVASSSAQSAAISSTKKLAVIEPVEDPKIGAGKKSTDLNVQVVTHADNPNKIEIHQKGALKSRFPIMVGSKWCPSVALRKTPSEAWLLGEDPNDPGGYIILDGKPITCGSVYTHTPNFPMSMHSQHKDIEVYVTIMTRRDPYFGNTYQLVPTITRRKVTLPGKLSLMQYDIVIEIMWNQPDMNPKEVGSVKPHLSRVPIFALFCYYGCVNNTDMRNYIFPGVDSSDERVRILMESVTTGPYHKALYDRAHPVTQMSALLHIGECILNPEAKKRYKTEIAADMAVLAKDMQLDQAYHEQVLTFLYEERVRNKAKDILDGTFFFNVNHDPRKVCLSMGSIVASMINIRLGREDPTDRSNLAFNRVQPIGEQFTGEAKKYIKKELIDPIVRRANDRLFERYSWEAMKDAFPFEVSAPVADVGSRLALKLKRAFKSSSKAQGQQPRLLEEVYDPKNIIFIWSKINEVTIRPSIGEKGTTITYVRRQVHPSHALFICGVQTPEAGADVGRYHQPTIYASLSTCGMETPVREILRMKDTNHPSPNPRLESSAETADDAAVEEEL